MREQKEVTKSDIQKAVKDGTNEILSALDDLINRIDDRFTSLENRMQLSEKHRIAEQRDILYLKQWSFEVSHKVDIPFEPR